MRLNGLAGAAETGRAKRRTQRELPSRQTRFITATVQPTAKIGIGA